MQGVCASSRALWLKAASPHDARMFKKIHALLQELSAYLGLLPATVGGSALSGLLTAWAAHITAVLKPYAPLSWVLASLVGAMLFTMIVLGCAVGRDRFISGGIKRRLYEEKARVNPLQKVLEKQRIRIEDLLTPLWPNYCRANFYRV